MPDWAWLLGMWLLAGLLLALGVARWFRYLHDGDEDES